MVKLIALFSLFAIIALSQCEEWTKQHQTTGSTITIVPLFRLSSGSTSGSGSTGGGVPGPAPLVPGVVGPVAPVVPGVVGPVAPVIPGVVNPVVPGVLAGYRKF